MGVSGESENRCCIVARTSFSRFQEGQNMIKSRDKNRKVKKVHPGEVDFCDFWVHNGAQRAQCWGEKDLCLRSEILMIFRIAK